MADRASGEVLVVNAGSSSLKAALVDPVSGTRSLTALGERLGTPDARLVLDGSEQALPGAGHRQALGAVLAAVDTARVVGVGHRVVHGGRRSASALVDDEVVADVEQVTALAPLHNPAALEGIAAARALLPDLPHVAVFDTAFHTTLPPAAHRYAVPEPWYAEHGVRRYGFHGTSHAYVSRRAAELLGRPPEDVNTVVLHLGNGASATAVAGGRSVDTSMGLTPLEGLVMGTRSGDLDPAIAAHLHRTAGLGPEEVDRALNTGSGLLALAGSNDLREVHRRIADGDESAALALEVFCHRLRKYVGAYRAVLGRTDAVVFTGGIGENDAVVRERSLAGLDTLGITLDPARNRTRSDAERVVSADGSPVTVFVVPTDEELEMARQTVALLDGAG